MRLELAGPDDVDEVVRITNAAYDRGEAGIWLPGWKRTEQDWTGREVAAGEREHPLELRVHRRVHDRTVESRARLLARVLEARHEPADRGDVLDSGLITMSGEAGALLADPGVRAAYLGE